MHKVTSLIVGLKALALASVASLPGHAAIGDQDNNAWRDAVSRGTLEAYEGYLERFPTGRHANLAFRAIIERSIAPRGLQAIEPGAGPEGEGVSVIVQNSGVVADLY